MSTINNNIPEQHKFKQICDELNLPCHFINNCVGTGSQDEMTLFNVEVENEEFSRNYPGPTGCTGPYDEYSGWEVVYPYSIQNFPFKTSDNEYAIHMGYKNTEQSVIQDWNYSRVMTMILFLKNNGIDFIHKTKTDRHRGTKYFLSSDGEEYMNIKDIEINDENVRELFDIYDKCVIKYESEDKEKCMYYDGDRYLDFNRDKIHVIKEDHCTCFASAVNEYEDECTRCTVEDVKKGCECFNIIYTDDLFDIGEIEFDYKNILHNMLYFKINKEFFDTIIVDRFENYVKSGAFNIGEQRRLEIRKCIYKFNESTIKVLKWKIEDEYKAKRYGEECKIIIKDEDKEKMIFDLQYNILGYNSADQWVFGS